MAARPDLADLLTRAARELGSHGDFDSTTQAVVQCLHAVLPSGYHVGLCLQRRQGVVETVGVSDDLVHDLERAQHELGEGTCPAALAGRDVARVDPLHAQHGWAGYLPVALPQGVDAQVSVRLQGAERLWGSLTVYSTGGLGIPPSTERLAELFGAHAAVALDRAHREDNLRIALSTRRVIGQALGLTMERFQLDEDLAFRYLVRLSSTGNVKLRDIARGLVDEANLKAKGGS